MTRIAIVGHTKRAQQVADLTAKTGANFVCMDDGKLGAGVNHVRAWEWLATTSDTWGLVLEDDAEPVDGFLDQLDLALAVAPEPVVNLYLGRGRPPHWWLPISSVIARDEHWIMADEMLNHVAVAVQTRMIPWLLKHLQRNDEFTSGRLPIDEALGRWVRYMGGQVAYSHPSLVDHAQLPTLITEHVSGHISETGVRSELRQAWLTGTREKWNRSRVAMRTPPVYTSYD